MLRFIKLAAIIVAGLSAFSTASVMAATDPGDIAYWQSVQGSKNPAEYRAYLSAFPHGAFSGLAQERIKEFGGGGSNMAQHAAPAAPAHLAEPMVGNVVGKGIITVDPATTQIGSKVKFTFQKFPHSEKYEELAVFAAGTPDTVVSADKVLGYIYLNDQSYVNGVELGPFAPGNYEVRWLTTLYNNENKVQVGARTAFSVGD